MLAWASISVVWAGQDQVVNVPRPIAGHPVFEMRVGADRVDDLRHPFLCAEGTPLPWLSIEGCGNGAGFLHKDEGLDFAHFRTKARLLGATSGRGTLDLLAGAGFAEIQRTSDQPGFKFGKPQEAAPVEAAGPELSMSLKGRFYADPGARTYLSADLNAGVAAIPGAPQVLGQGGPVLPFAAFTVGLGF
jgi:hypothetical protein